MIRRALGVLALIALAACGEKASPPAAQKPETPVGDSAAGKVIAQRGCVGCHRDDGSGAAPGIPRLARQSEAYLVQSMQQYAAGSRHHAVLKDMTPQLNEIGIRNVAAYYAALPPIAAAATKPPVAPSPYERGKASAAACSGCHGADGNSTAAGTPSLAGQQPIYLLAALAEYHRGERSTPELRAMLRKADQVDLESLALYYASQAPVRREPAAVGDAAAGEALTLRCSGCHGVRGVSNDAATPSLAGQDAQYLARALRAYGKDRHNASMERQLAGLGEQDLRNLAAYYAAQEGRPAERAQDVVARLAEKCDRCHGQEGGAAAGTTATPRIGGQDKVYLVMALRAYRDDRRASSTMHKMSMPYSEAVIDGLAAHYAAQPSR